MKKLYKQQGTQAGMTLMEVLAALAIVASVVVGSLSLFGSANSASISSQLQKDIVALRTATQSAYNGQGSYGTASLNPMLIASNKVPTSMRVSGANITTSTNGAVTVTGANTNFTMALTSVPADVCVALVTGLSSGWTNVTVNGGATQTTFPVTPTVATGSDGCNVASNTITWTTPS
ncbi:MAG: putative type pilus biosis protein [Paucimonas sp.]|nr:putative type pilus biosis protein [Paucimonas sp.]